MYKVSEIFYSLQGEGARAGTANIFIRFSGCNLTCNFCDTEFESGTQYSAQELVSKASAFGCKNVIFTGGEPLQQVDQALISEFKSAGFYIACETNGTIKDPGGIDYIVCSPKIAEHVMKKSFPNGVQELRYVRHTGQSIPEPSVKADFYYLSPQNSGDQLNRENLRYCIELCKANPQWRLSTQMHKLWKVL